MVIIDNSGDYKGIPIINENDVPKIFYRYGDEKKSNVDNKYSKYIKNSISCEKPDICEKYKIKIDKLKETITNLNVINDKLVKTIKNLK